MRNWQFPLLSAPWGSGAEVLAKSKLAVSVSNRTSGFWRRGAGKVQGRADGDGGRDCGGGAAARAAAGARPDQGGAADGTAHHHTQAVMRRQEEILPAMGDVSRSGNIRAAAI